MPYTSPTAGVIPSPNSEIPSTSASTSASTNASTASAVEMDEMVDYDYYSYGIESDDESEVHDSGLFEFEDE